MVRLQDDRPITMTGRAYCISLASKPERRAFCERQFKAEGLDVATFDAIVVDDAGAFPSKGARGCYLSHRRVLELALEQAQPRQSTVTIFEDDVLLPRGFGKTVRQLEPMLAHLDWQLFYWGMLNQPPVEQVQSQPLLATIAPEHTIIGKQAYSIRVSAIPPLLEYLYHCETQHPTYSDGMFHMYRMERDLVTHTHTLRQAKQASFASNLTPRAGDTWMHNRLRALKRCLQLVTR